MEERVRQEEGGSSVVEKLLRFFTKIKVVILHV